MRITATDQNGAKAEATYTITIAAAIHITTSILPNGVVGTDYSATVEAADGAPGYGWTSTGLPGGLILNSSTGAITGNPYEVGTFDAVKITATDRNGATAEATFTITIAPAVHITTMLLPDAVLNEAYPTTTVEAAGGTGPYTWSATGLPAGVSVNTSTGVLSGIPTESGPFSAAVTVTDANHKTAEASFSFTVHPELAITTAELPAAIVGEQYSVTLAGLGGNTPYTWAVTDLPDGLTLDTSIGAITGTPTVAGSVDLDVTLTDKNERTATTTLSLSVRDAVHVTMATVPNGVVGTEYSGSISAGGGTAPYSWDSTALPAGLVLSEGGALSGTPTIDGTTPVTFTVTDSHGTTATTDVSITIVKAVHITTTELPSGVVGTSYPGITLSAADGNSGDYTWQSNTLPAGLSLSAAGKITGTPTTAGTFDAVKITVTDAAGKSAEATFTVVVAPAVHITTASLPDANLGESYSVDLEAAGGTAAYVWSSSELPEGLALDADNGTIAGTPTQAGTFDDIQLTVTDANDKTDSVAVSLTVIPAVHVTTATLPTVEAGDPYPATTLEAAGGTAPYSWTVDTLPAGLTLTNGVIEGTPTTAGTTTVTVTVTDAHSQTATAALSITVNAAAHLTTTALSIGVIGGDYTTTLTAAGGTSPYTYAVSTLPEGITFSGDTLSGTPTTADTNTPVEVTVTDARGRSNTATLGLTVVAPKTMSGGANHTCSVTASGGIECWGTNNSGQLGDGTTQSSNYPVSVSGLSGKALSVSAGNNHTCAVMASGKVECWGYNNFGQLGIGNNTAHPTAQEVPNVDGAVSIGAGQYDTCASLSDGSVRCWGMGTAGQLGNGASANSTSPVTVSAISNVVDVETGTLHVCALTASGDVACWGRNSQRQVGAGGLATTANYNTPVAVPDVSHVVSLSAHLGLHTCVATATGAVKCWGNNSAYQLGTTDASVSVSADALTIADVTGAVSVISGGNHSCAINAAGTMHCWGANNSGQLGDGNVGDSSASSVRVNLADPVASAAAGTTHTCARTTTGVVNCWGGNSGGQLASGYSSTITNPLEIPALSGAFSSISMGNASACGVTPAGGVKCWGLGSSGELGNNSTASSTDPVQVEGLTSGVSAVSVAQQHACALLSSGEVKCWGSNTSGELGNNSQTNSSVPVTPQGLTSGVVSVSVGLNFACAVLNDGTAKCWGSNTSNQLGNNTVSSSSTIPTSVLNLTDATSVSAGNYHACVVTTSGTVKCWGTNSNYQLGDGTTTSRTSPVSVSGITSGATQVSAAGSSTCALVDSAVKCWGYNGSGQLGNGTVIQSGQPGAVSGLSASVASIDAGDSHVCALRTDGTLTCWGAGISGQLGNGTLTNSLTPVEVSLPSKASTVTAGLASTCAVLTDNTVRCWGLNSTDQLAIQTSYNETPTPVTGFDVAALAASTVTLDAGVVGTVYADHQLTATGGASPYTWTSTTLPAGLSLSSTGVLSGTPTEAGTTEVTFTVTDVRGKSATTTASITIIAAVHITTDAALPGGVVGTAYSTQLEAAEGTGPYTWSSDVVPAGLTLSQDGVLSGTPTAATASTTMQITATDHNGKTATKAFTVVITPVIHGAAALSAGYSSTCAVTDAGGVECWGNNDLGQLGNGTTTASTIPVQVSGLSSGVRAVAVGASHACALTDAGGVKCWGTNQIGQLGNGGTTGTHEDGTPYISTSPVDVAGLTSGVKAIGAGTNHTCAVTNAGAVKCWGYNTTGQLGNNSTTDSSIPVQAISSGVVAVTGGNASTCALTDAGGVKCWGSNNKGQIGIDISTTVQLTPVDVPALTSGVTSLSVGGRTACVAMTDGDLKCWGNNANGQLGVDADITPYSVTPVVPSGVPGAKQVATATTHACVLTTTGGVLCWGDNTYGQLGDDTTASRSMPATVEGLSSGVVAVSTNLNRSCALLDNGSVKCWGSNEVGQLGDGSLTDSHTPADVFGYGSVPIHIATSSLPVGEVGTAYPATKINLSGGTAPYTWSVSGLPDGLSINTSTGVISGTPLTATVATVSVAANDAGGNTVFADLSLTIVSAVHITTTSLPNGAVDTGYYAQLAAADGAGVFYTWSSDTLPAGLTLSSSGMLSGTPTTATVATPVTVTVTDEVGGTATQTYTIQITAPIEAVALVAKGGAGNSCALTSNGGVECWGLNDHGQLGNGTTTNALSPVPVSGLSSGVVSVVSGASHSCALTTSGGVKCWGLNSSGQVGNQTFDDQHSPVDVFGLDSGVIAIGAGVNHSCAVLTTGAVTCWGSDSAGQLGDSQTANNNVPVSTGITSGATQVAGGAAFTCALVGGGVQCWGANTYGQLGDDSGTASLTPVAVSGLTNGVASLAAYAQGACVVTNTGGAKCWGLNGTGQLGNGTTDNAFAPVDVFGLSSGVAQIAVGSTHACAVTTAGAVECWGNNNKGQLGDGTFTTSTTPVASGLSSGVRRVSAGAQRSCAVLTTGGLKCWGAGESGQLGDGSTPESNPNPVDVFGYGATPVSITTTSVPAGAVGSAYAGATMAATGGTSPYTWTAWGLPTGLSLSSAGVLSGTPTAAGSWPDVTVWVADAAGNRSATTLSMSAAYQPLSITTASLSSGMVSSAYTSTAMAASGGDGSYTWSATNLPSGVTLSAAGVWGGTPTTAGSKTVTITLTDGSGLTAQKSLSLTVVATLAITTSSLSSTLAEAAYTSPDMSATGGTAPYTWSATNLPSGITLSSAGVWGGSAPFFAGDYTVTVTVTDAAGRKASRQLSIYIARGSD